MLQQRFMEDMTGRKVDDDRNCVILVNRYFYVRNNEILNLVILHMVICSSNILLVSNFVFDSS